VLIAGNDTVWISVRRGGGMCSTESHLVIRYDEILGQQFTNVM